MIKLPEWFKQGIPGKGALNLSQVLSELNIRTVCKEAHCPNSADCFSDKQMTFMILGDTCTRNCAFCAVNKNPEVKFETDLQEPLRISVVVKALGLKYIVVTSVTRDDLADGGAEQFAKTIEIVRSLNKGVLIEVLIPDFMGNFESLKTVLNKKPDVLAHNIETVNRLYKEVRQQGNYRTSLNLLNKAKEINCGIITKSSLMLGLGEKEEEVINTMQDLRGSLCDYLTLGQYLAPSSQHYPVKEFIHPEQFRRYREIGIKMGFKNVFSGPKVRSSYHAKELIMEQGYA